jgi:hypothetical protein
VGELDTPGEVYTAAMVGNDGTTYLFSTYLRGPGWLSAQTWSPDADLPPKWLADLGETVLRYSRAQKHDPRQLAEVVSREGTRLLEYFRHDTSK